MKRTLQTLEACANARRAARRALGARLAGTIRSGVGVSKFSYLPQLPRFQELELLRFQEPELPRFQEPESPRPHQPLLPDDP